MVDDVKDGPLYRSEALAQALLDASTHHDNDHEDREPIPEDATPEEIEKAAEHDISVQSLRHFIAYEAERKANPPRGRAPVIKLDTTKRDMFAADKDRGDRAAWKASGSNRTFEDWKADRDAEALQSAQDKHAAMAADAEAKTLAAEVRKAEAAARKAERALAKAKAAAEKAAAEAETEALPVDYKGAYEALSNLFAVTSDRKVGLLIELTVQSQRTFMLSVHQFMRLGDEWWNDRFNKKVARRATDLHKEMFDRLPPKTRMRNRSGQTGLDQAATQWGFWVNLYPRGILEQAFAQVVKEIREKEGEAGLDAYRIEPFNKAPPSGLEEIDEIDKLHEVIDDIYAEMMAEGRQIRSSESKTNTGQWKRRKLNELRRKLSQLEDFGGSWGKRPRTESPPLHPPTPQAKPS